MKIDWSKWEKVEVKPLEAMFEGVLAHYMSVEYGCELVHRRFWDGTTHWECQKFFFALGANECILAEGWGGSAKEAYKKMVDKLRNTLNNLQQILKEMEEG